MCQWHILPDPRKNQTSETARQRWFCLCLFQIQNIFFRSPKYIIRRGTTFVNRQIRGGGNMDENDQERIVLPENLQLDMLKFFLRTSIPRIMKEKQQQAENSLSDKKSDKE